MKDLSLKYFFEPITLLTDVNSRLYFGYLIAAFLLAFLALALMQKKMALRSALHILFSPKVWLNRSTLLDLGLLSINVWLKVLVWVPVFMSAFSVAFSTVKGLNWLIPVSAFPLSVSKPVIVAVYTLVLVLALDFSRYLLHRLMHRSSWLWRFHKVHHSARTMTPLTLYRVHPVESMLQYLRDVLVTGCLTGVFFFCFGPGLDVLTVAGVNVVRLAFNYTGANLRHSHIWLSFGPFERVFISPAQHQIHHSSAPEHLNKNFGSQFAIWDRIFGSLYLTSRREKLAFGLAEGQKSKESNLI